MRRRPKKAVFSLGLGRFWLFCPLRRLTGRLDPYGKPLTERDGPYGKGRSLRESPLRGWLPLQKRTAYGKLWGEILPELGGNFRLCAVDQKRPFFLGPGRFWPFCPLRRLTRRASPLREAPYGEGRSLREGPVLTGSPLTGALTGRPPYGKATYRGGFLREGPLRITGKLTGALTGRGLLRGGALLTGWALMRRESPLRGRALTGKEGPEGQGCVHPLPRFRVI